MNSSAASLRELNHPLAALTPDEFDAMLAELRLIDFVRYGWSSFEKAKFIDNWHIEAICEHLEAVSKGDLTRLIINIPPRHMKSTGVCVAWPAWTWLQDPDAFSGDNWLGPSTQFLFTSYAQSLSTRDSVKCRRLIRSKWYKAHWAKRFGLVGDSNTKSRFDNDALGYRIATSLGGMTTGEGGDIVVIDDPHNVKQAESDAVRQGVLTTWDEALASRLNDPQRGAFVLICQRVKEDDLTGHILANETGWTQLCLPARFEVDHPNRWYGTPGVRFVDQRLYNGDPRTEDGELLWPNRIDLKTLDTMEKRMGSYAVAGQMQQRPVPREGGMFKRAWFADKTYRPEDVPRGTRWVRHWDLAATKRAATDTKGARTAGVKMGRAPDGRIFIASCIAEAWEGVQVKKEILATAKIDGQGVVVSLPQDPGQAGKTQKADYATLLEGHVFKIKGELGDKEQRAEPFASQVEAGQVYLLEGATWIDGFLDEVCLFPGGKRKDIVDACSGCYHHLVTRIDKELEQGVGIAEVFEADKPRPGYDY